MNIQRRTLVAATIAAGLPLPLFAQKKIVLGFSQVGAESEWRTANTESIKPAAKDSRHRPEVRRRAAEAGEPDQGDPLLHRAEGRRDRLLAGGRNRLGHGAAGSQGREDPGDPDRPRRRRQGRQPVRHASWARTSSRKAARPAAGWSSTRRARPAPINIVELQGTVGSAPAIDRKKGFEEIIKADPKLKIIRSQTGDFTRAKGKEVMEAFLKAEGKKINVLYAHNDDMAIGAIQAIEEAGLKPAKDITIISIDGVKGAFEAMMAGKLNVSGRMQPAARPAADAGGQGRRGRQDDAQAHRDAGRHLPEGSGGQGIPEPQVLIA